MFLTSNGRPSDDSGYRSKTTIIHHSKDEVHARFQKEAKEFQNWLKCKLDILGVLGDFIARYFIVKPEKPEQSILFNSDKSYDDMAKEIITEFYKSAGKDRPSWLDWTLCSKVYCFKGKPEQAYFQLRGFLMGQVTNAYSRHIRTYSKKSKCCY